MRAAMLPLALVALCIHHCVAILEPPILQNQYYKVSSKQFSYDNYSHEATKRVSRTLAEDTVVPSPQGHHDEQSVLGHNVNQQRYRRQLRRQSGELFSTPASSHETTLALLSASDTGLHNLLKKKYTLDSEVASETQTQSYDTSVEVTEAIIADEDSDPTSETTEGGLDEAKAVEESLDVESTDKNSEVEMKILQVVTEQLSRSSAAQDEQTKELTQILRSIRSLLEEFSFINDEEQNSLEKRMEMLQEKTLTKFKVLENMYKTHAKTIDEKIATLTDGITGLQSNVEGLSGAVTQTLEEISSVKNEINDARSQIANISKVRDEISEEAANIALQEVSVPSVDEDDVNMNESIHELINKTVSNELWFERLQTTVKELNNATTDTVNKINEMQSQIAYVNNTMRSHSMFIDILQSSSAASQVEIDNMKALLSRDQPLLKTPSSSNEVTGTKNGELSASLQKDTTDEKLLSFEKELEAVRVLRDEVALLRREFTTTQVLNVTSALCVWPYKPAGTGCFHVHTEERLSWVQARETCQQMQGDLAAPLNFEVFRKFLINLKLSRSYSFWAGARTRDKRWSWVDGRTVSDDVWAPGQPNNLRAEACLEVRPDLRLFGADEPCRLPNYFICQQRGS